MSAPLRWIAGPTPVAAVWHELPDYSDALISANITYARSAPHEAPRPLTAQVKLARTVLPLEVGTLFSLWLGGPLDTGPDPDDLRPYVRFTGEITDLEVPTGGAPMTITATGCYARRGRLKRRAAQPGVAMPDITAAFFMAALAGMVPDYRTPSTPGVDVQLPAEPRPVAEHLSTIAASSGASIVEQRDGVVQFVPYESRRHDVIEVDLGREHALPGAAYGKSGADVVNSVTVRTATAAEVNVTDVQAVDWQGEQHAELDTYLADPGPAASLAVRAVARRSRPSWRVPPVTVDMLHTPGMTPELRRALLNLRMGSLVRLWNMHPPNAATPELYYDAHVEGATETITLSPGRTPTTESTRRLTYRLTLVLSDRRMSGPAMRWIDVIPGRSWANVRPGTTWLDAGRTVFDTITEG